MSRVIALVCACALSACGTLQTVQTLHPELVNHGKDVVAFTACADILGSPLAAHFLGSSELSIAEIIDLALETIRCGNHVAVDAQTEEAKSAVGIGSLAADGPVVVPALPASAEGFRAAPTTKRPKVTLDPNPYEPQ